MALISSQKALIASVRFAVESLDAFARGVGEPLIDSVSISFREQEEEVHRELLSNGTLILENLNLDGVSDGNYILCALPLKLGGMEASPVRAVLFCRFQGIVNCIVVKLYTKNVEAFVDCAQKRLSEFDIY